ncbi:MAG: magnesium and cobalt transport protein CorA [Segetibacter sp.]|jgi:magnesium transporter|nr:magnesium and cobalt transport protein CorA [Segetibacter sp.]
MIQYFKNINNETVEVDKPENGIWVNLVPPFKEEEFLDLGEELDIPIQFLRDSLDIDERPRYEIEDNVKFIVIKTPTENNSFNDSDAFYITIPICIILTHNHIVTVNSFDNGAIKKFLNSFQKRHPDKRNLMVLKIFDKVVSNFMDYLKEINHQRNSLEQKLYDTNRNEELLELVRIQKSLVYFVTALRSNELLMMKLERTNFLSLNEDELEVLNDLIIDNSQALEMANTYSNLLSSTLNTFASIAANNQNDILKKLMGLILLLAVPAFLIGIYCMSVAIPKQNSPYTFWFPVIISFIILIATGFAYFNWIRKTKSK